MANERLYIVTYDISDPKRLRRVFRILKGFGHWLQFSVFQCRLTGRRRSEMTASLEEAMNMAQDHILIMDLGPADKVDVRVESLGRQYEAPKRQPTIV
ncbi:MAG: CRISPR-associated endonuclease Cas2 [Bacteroidota bacterium]|nr:CRISPR-associated endonuclease Cas2 [Bacteroidota bacterium]MDE2956077.1 CRISPR-associated endonuclease Cas2 [Bacteroidota bacterium]